MASVSFKGAKGGHDYTPIYLSIFKHCQHLN